MSDVKDTKHSPVKLIKMDFEEGLKKLKSHSLKNPFLNDFISCLDFAPKLK